MDRPDLVHCVSLGKAQAALNLSAYWVRSSANQDGSAGRCQRFARASPGKAHKNGDQVYAFIEYLQTPEASAAAAEGSGYNPVITGADALLSETAKRNFQEAFPGDALANLWHGPAEPSWFAELRTQYADKFKAA